LSELLVVVERPSLSGVGRGWCGYGGGGKKADAPLENEQGVGGGGCGVLLQCFTSVDSGWFC